MDPAQSRRLAARIEPSSQLTPREPAAPEGIADALASRRVEGRGSVPNPDRADMPTGSPPRSWHGTREPIALSPRGVILGPEPREQEVPIAATVPNQFAASHQGARRDALRFNADESDVGPRTRAHHQSFDGLGCAHMTLESHHSAGGRRWALGVESARAVRVHHHRSSDVFAAALSTLDRELNTVIKILHAAYARGRFDARSSGSCSIEQRRIEARSAQHPRRRRPPRPTPITTGNRQPIDRSSACALENVQPGDRFEVDGCSGRDVFAANLGAGEAFGFDDQRAHAGAR